MTRPLPSVRSFLNEIIDYAGLFPPAALQLEQAVRSYAAYQRGLESWMLSRFVCPAARLKELRALASLFDAERPLIVSAVGAKNVTAETFAPLVRESIAAMADFRDGERAQADALELQLPVDAEGAAVSEAMAIVAREARTLALFFELGVRPASVSTTLHRVLDLIAAANTDRGEVPRAGFKLRCGGPVAEAIPSSAEVAAVIAACRDRGVPLKFTAGLHHPGRNHDPTLQALAHGFLNIFAAGMLAHTLALGEAEVQEIVDEPDVRRFVFDAHGFAWRDRQIRVPAISEARRSAVLSFGSCSFEEPRDDLQALGLL